MKATITDKAAINSIRPTNLIGYLRSKNWSLYNDRSSNFSVWINDDYPDNEIIVPQRREASDFTLRLADALRELEIAEGRSQLDILRDLITSGFDVVKLSAKSNNMNDGTIKFEDGVEFFSRAKDMLLAAACSTVSPRAVFHARKPQDANNYMSSTRLGQTEHGSYVLTILSPVSPQLTAHGDTDLFPIDPFERRVVKTLAKSIESVTRTAERVMLVDRDFLQFQDAVQHGVSANLCEAIVGFFKLAEPASISFDVSWANNRPRPNDIAAHTEIDAYVVPIIEEAARLFRAYEPMNDLVLQGPIIKLERDEGQTDGRITLLAKIEDAFKRIIVNLPQSNYDLAANAHQSFKEIRVVGDVMKEGRSFAVRNLKSFAIADSVTIDDE